jgi:hypothetical protein
VAMLVVLLSVNAQKSEVFESAGEIKTAEGQLQKRQFKANNPEMEEVAIFDLTGINGTTFSSSNISDGSSNSYKHSQKITMAMGVVTSKPLKVNIVFYSTNDKIPYASSITQGELQVFYPIEMYSDIRTRLEQAFSAKKKVQLKTTAKPDGYRESSLML